MPSHQIPPFQISSAVFLLGAATASASPLFTPFQQTTQATLQQAIPQSPPRLHPGIKTAFAPGASCTATLPLSVDSSTKDDWDFCCLQEYGVPFPAKSSVDLDVSHALDWYVEDGQVLLQCDLRAEYANGLMRCFKEFSGLNDGFGDGEASVECVGIEKQGS